VSQVLTLFTTPVIYLGFDSLAKRMRKRFGKEKHPDDDAPSANAPLVPPTQV